MRGRRVHRALADLIRVGEAGTPCTVSAVADVDSDLTLAVSRKYVCSKIPV
jgi:hypothetical protein